MRISKRCKAAAVAAGLAAMIGLPAGAQQGADSPRASGAESYPLQPGTIPARPRHVPPDAMAVDAAPAKPEPSAAQKQTDAKAQQDRQKQSLSAAMERVAEHWRERAQAQGWASQPPTPVEPLAGIEASNQQASASGQPGGKLGEAARDAPVRSEKAGTAPPSEDVEQVAPREDVKPAVDAAAPAASR